MVIEKILTGRSDYIHEFRVYFTACIPGANVQRIEDEYALSLDSQLGEISPVTNPAISAPLIRSARSFRSERKIFSVTQIVVPVMDYLDVDTITSITSERLASMRGRMKQISVDLSDEYVKFTKIIDLTNDHDG